MKRKPSALNLLIGVDKPAGMTSHDVVNRVRHAVGERRVGHAGTLDPAATGVMVVGVGQATRLMGHLTAEKKSYLATIEFGSETDTEDAEGTVIRTAPVPSDVRDTAFAARTVAGLVGGHQQVPPAYSAISVNGERAYARARAGEAVELPPRPIQIFEAQLLSIEEGEHDGSGASVEQAGDAPEHLAAPVRWQCAFTVSKGTYIRSIARDLGRSLGTAAHLVRLRRTVSGLVTLGDCLTLPELDSLGAQGVPNRCIDPLRVLNLDVRVLSESEHADVLCGRPIPLGTIFSVDTSRRDVLTLHAHAGRPVQGQKVAVFRDDRLWGIWQVRGDVLRSSVNFPVGITGIAPTVRA